MIVEQLLISSIFITSVLDEQSLYPTVFSEAGLPGPMLKLCDLTLQQQIIYTMDCSCWSHFAGKWLSCSGLMYLKCVCMCVCMHFNGFFLLHFSGDSWQFYGLFDLVRFIVVQLQHEASFSGHLLWVTLTNKPAFDDRALGRCRKEFSGGQELRQWDTMGVTIASSLRKKKHIVCRKH